MVKEKFSEEQIESILDTEEAVDEVERVKPYQKYLEAKLEG